MKCYDCPRNCGVDRAKDKGFCREGEKIRIAKIIENFMWEEPCITGDKGALAIFFSGCNLRCKFCQNYEISHIGKGKLYGPEEFAALLKGYDLTKFSCIDLITPTHFSSALCKAFDGLKLPIPVIWNSSGYEKTETIERISKFVDVFLVDLKYVDGTLSGELSCAKDYFEVASKALLKMSDLKFNIFEGDQMKQGVLIRHLILPGHVEDSIKVLDFVKNKVPDAHISIMSQFTPIAQSPIKRKLTPLELKIVMSHADKIGLKEGYFQDLDSASDNFIPNF